MSTSETPAPPPQPTSPSAPAASPFNALPDPSADYLSLDAIVSWCLALAEAAPRWVSLHEAGRSREGRPLLLLTVGDHASGDPDARPSLWLDAITHASEWTGASALLHSLRLWVEGLLRGDPDLIAWFQAHTVTAMPCISPDGYDAMWRGEPFLRSTLRPARASTAPRVGLDPCDIDGDGRVGWMRWRHEAGPFVIDDTAPLGVRWRTLSDPPSSACFLCDEGQLLSWDGARWVAAPLRFGLDLNRNFPAEWKPFSMFGMDSGDFPLSEPESRAVMESFIARPYSALALSMHTYTGCLLTEPNRADTPISDADIRMMESLALQAVEGTGYRVFRSYPDFMYNPKKPTIGIWTDTQTEHLGVPAYTVELWDPYGYAQEPIDNPAASFVKPDIPKNQRVLEYFATKHPECVWPWRAFDHPQLGPVELGGFDYMRTIRNPPPSQLAAECARAHTITDRARAALPRARCTSTLTALGPNLHTLDLLLENLGYLPTFGLSRALETGAAPSVCISLDLPPTLRLDPITPAAEAGLPHLSGWGWAQHDGSAHPIYPGLSSDGHRAAARWLLHGHGTLSIRWRAGRAGEGSLTLSL
jgi:hypothetical protein